MGPGGAIPARFPLLALGNHSSPNKPGCRVPGGVPGLKPCPPDSTQDQRPIPASSLKAVLVLPGAPPQAPACSRQPAAPPGEGRVCVVHQQASGRRETTLLPLAPSVSLRAQNEGHSWGKNSSSVCLEHHPLFRTPVGPSRPCAQLTQHTWGKPPGRLSGTASAFWGAGKTGGSAGLAFRSSADLPLAAERREGFCPQYAPQPRGESQRAVPGPGGHYAPREDVLGPGEGALSERKNAQGQPNLFQSTWQFLSRTRHGPGLRWASLPGSSDGSGWPLPPAARRGS